MKVEVRTENAAAMDAANPVRIAFVCTGNTGRSVVAEVLAREIIGKHQLNARARSYAVNLDPNNARPEAHFVTLLRRRGIDLSPHIATQFGARDAASSDLILTMTHTHKAWAIAHFPGARDRIFGIAEYATGQPEDVPDAFGRPMDFCKTILRQLDRLVGAAVLKAVKP